MPPGRFYRRAIVPSRARVAPLSPVVILDIDELGARLIDHTGELLADGGDAVADALMHADRNAVVWTDPGRANLVTRLYAGGVLGPMIAAGWQLQPVLSGSTTVAVRLLRSREHERAHGRIQNVRAWAPNLPHADASSDRVRIAQDAAVAVSEAVYGAFGIAPAVTPASTAFECWRACMPPGCHYRQSKRADPDMRRAYFGGIVASRPGELANVRQYDMRGAYAWALREGVPIGAAAYTVAEYPRDVPGIYRVKAVLNPRAPSPFMVRQPFTGYGMLAPTGQIIETYATSEDIALAREWRGVVEVIDGWVWLDGVGKPFDDFVARIDRMETQHDGVARAAAKQLRNSLYGRFGRKLTIDQLVISEECPDDVEYMPYMGVAGPRGAMWIKKNAAHDPAGSMPHWAAWITAAVRRRLLRAWSELVAADATVFYVDTDAIITNGTLETGTEYGDWRLQRVYRQFRVFASKRYAGLTTDGDMVVAWAGIARPESGRVIEQWAAGHRFALNPPKHDGRP